MSEKTHWLQSPNKNYLGHWDLPEQDLILTIDSAQWEEVKNPIINVSEAKRVVRFKEDYKPLICNQTNAQSILTSTGCKYMEESGGQKIALFISTVLDRRAKEDVDCIRIRNKKPQAEKPVLNPKSEKWETACIRVAEGMTFEELSKHYQITQKDFDSIIPAKNVD